MAPWWGGHKNASPSQGLSVPICNMGEQTRASWLPPVGFSVYILTPESAPQRQAPLGPFVVGLSARRPGQERQFQDDSGVSLPDLTPSPFQEAGPCWSPE